MKHELFFFDSDKKIMTLNDGKIWTYVVIRKITPNKIYYTVKKSENENGTSIFGEGTFIDAVLVSIKSAINIGEFSIDLNTEIIPSPEKFKSMVEELRNLITRAAVHEPTLEIETDLE